MKLFLASRVSGSLNLALPLISKSSNSLKLAFITTAANPYPLDLRPWVSEDRAKAISLGFQITDYDISGKNVTTLRADLSKFDVILVDGGNTFYLLEQVRKTGFDIVIQELLNKGIVYIGSSAGSCIMCPTIEHLVLVDHQEVVPDIIDYTGLKLIDKLLVPHAGREKYLSRHDMIKSKWGSKVTFISDDQAVIVNGDRTEIVTA